MPRRRGLAAESGGGHQKHLKAGNGIRKVARHGAAGQEGDGWVPRRTFSAVVDEHWRISARPTMPSHSPKGQKPCGKSRFCRAVVRTPQSREGIWSSIHHWLATKRLGHGERYHSRTGIGGNRLPAPLGR